VCLLRGVALIHPRYLLKFGQPSYYLGYNAMSNYFPSTVMRPNPDCVNHFCRKLQETHRGWQPFVWERVTQSSEPVNHDDEEDWGIDIEPSDDEAEPSAAPGSGGGGSVAKGLTHAYEALPAPAQSSESDAAAAANVPEESMEDMMAQLAALGGD